MFRFISEICRQLLKRNLTIPVWLMVSLTLTVSFAYVERKTGICFKLRANESMPVVSKKASFLELVEANKVFVDKSMLIKEIMELKDPVVLITLPNGWGKTMNLDMMKMFFELQVDKYGTPTQSNLTKNYKFFVNGLITPKNQNITSKLKSPPRISAETEFCDKHLSRYPVIRLDLRIHFEPSTFEDTTNQVRMQIGQTFDEHEYMVKVFRKIIDDESNSIEVRAKARKDLYILEKFLSRGEENIAIMLKSVKFLCRILFEHFKKKVIIVVDDYDFVFGDIFAWVFEPFFYERTEIAETDVLKYYGKLMKFTFNENQYLEKAIITGNQRICAEYLFAEFNTSIATFDYFEHGLSEFYGFTRAETDSIFLKADIPTELKTKAFNWYWGYAVATDDATTIFNPWDIVSFVEKREVNNYWLDVGGKYWFQTVLKLEAMHVIFKTLHDGRDWLFVDFSDAHLSRNDFVILGKMIHEAFANYKYPMNHQEIQLLLKYLCSVGYLTGQGSLYDSRIGRDAIRVRIPNQALRTEFMNFTLVMKNPFSWPDMSVLSTLGI